MLKYFEQPVMSGLDTVAVLRALGRKDLVVGITGQLSSFYMWN